MTRRLCVMLAVLTAALSGCGEQGGITALLPVGVGAGQANTEQMFRNFEEEYPRFRVDATWVARANLAATAMSARRWDVIALESSCVPMMSDSGVIVRFPASEAAVSDLFSGHIAVFSHKGQLMALPWAFDAQCVFVRPIRWIQRGGGELPELWPEILPDRIAVLRRDESEDWVFRVGLLSQAFGENRFGPEEEPLTVRAAESPVDRSVGLALSPEAGEGAAELVQYLCGRDVQANFARITPPTIPSLYERGEVQAHVDEQVREVVSLTGMRLRRARACSSAAE